MFMETEIAWNFLCDSHKNGYLNWIGVWK